MFCTILMFPCIAVCLPSVCLIIALATYASASNVQFVAVAVVSNIISDDIFKLIEFIFYLCRTVQQL